MQPSRAPPGVTEWLQAWGRGDAQAEERLYGLVYEELRLQAARLLTYWAAGMKDRTERCDLEAGMAKLYATEAAQQNAADALEIFGPAAQLTSFDVERHYRDTPLMIIGEGTNEGGVHGQGCRHGFLRGSPRG